MINMIRMCYHKLRKASRWLSDFMQDNPYDNPYEDYTWQYRQVCTVLKRHRNVKGCVRK